MMFSNAATTVETKKFFSFLFGIKIEYVKKQASIAKGIAISDSWILYFSKLITFFEHGSLPLFMYFQFMLDHFSAATAASLISSSYTFLCSFRSESAE